MYICTRQKTTPGLVVQLVRISACHAEGRGFESRPHRKEAQRKLGFFVLEKKHTTSYKFLYIWANLSLMTV